MNDCGDTRLSGNEQRNEERRPADRRRYRNGDRNAERLLAYADRPIGLSESGSDSPGVPGVLDIEAVEPSSGRTAPADHQPCH